MFTQAGLDPQTVPTHQALKVKFNYFVQEVDGFRYNKISRDNVYQNSINLIVFSCKKTV